MEYQKITKVSKNLQQVIQTQLQMTNKRYISPEKRQNIIDNLRRIIKI